MSDLRVVVETVVDTTYASQVDVGDLRGRKRTVTGETGRSVEITVRARCNSAEQADEWREAAGKTFRLVPVDTP